MKINGKQPGTILLGKNFYTTYTCTLYNQTFKWLQTSILLSVSWPVPTSLSGKHVYLRWNMAAVQLELNIMIYFLASKRQIVSLPFTYVLRIYLHDNLHIKQTPWLFKVYSIKHFFVTLLA